jgi:hypothetical protein
LNSEGNFLDREDAMLEAHSCGQVTDERFTKDKRLYSEDLY